MGHVLRKLSLIEYKVKFVSENPDYSKVREHEMLIVGGKRFVKWAYFKCPCGCGETVVLPLIKSKGPSWSLKVDRLGRPTLTPSIWKTEGCKSHFYIKKGLIIWTNY